MAKASGQRTTVASFETYSFILFGAISLCAMALFQGYYVLFVFLLAVDGLATVAKLGWAVAIDRVAFFASLLVLSLTVGGYTVFFLFAEVILVVTCLDMSFFLRRLGRTIVEDTVIRHRVMSYAYTMLPAFLLSYSLAFLYSLVSAFPSSEAVAFLAVSSAVGLSAIYALSRYLSTRSTDSRGGMPSER
jgi:hypothetical protein